MKKLVSSSSIVLAFILIPGVLSFVYLWKSLIDINLSLKLDKETQSYITRFQIDEEVKKDKFIVGVSYEYYVDGNKYVGKTLFSKRKFLSYFAAMDAINKLSNNPPKVSYSSKDVTFSQLDHHFSFKNSIYFCISFGVLVYFIVLRRSFKKFE